MSHSYHRPSNQTIYHDECPECIDRAGRLSGINELDGRNRVKAWHYMRAWSWSGGQWTRDADEPTQLDRQLFTRLYTIAVFLQRAGIQPDEVERRMIEQHDRDVARAGLESLEPIGPELRGINITGIFVAGADTAAAG